MESEIVVVGEILGRLAQRYGFRSDVALAEHLGVSRQTVGNWRSRGSLDHALLIRAFPDADLNWLFRGASADPLALAAAELRAKGLRMILEPLPAAPAAPRPQGEGSQS
jgi:hypothetical protein